MSCFGARCPTPRANLARRVCRGRRMECVAGHLDWRADRDGRRRGLRARRSEDDDCIGVDCVVCL